MPKLLKHTRLIANQWSFTCRAICFSLKSFFNYSPLYQSPEHLLYIFLWYFIIIQCNSGAARIFQREEFWIYVI